MILIFFVYIDIEFINKFIDVIVLTKWRCLLFFIACNANIKKSFDFVHVFHFVNFEKKNFENVDLFEILKIIYDCYIVHEKK